MKLTVHLEGKNRAELAAGLRAHLELFGDTATTATPVKTTRAAKPAPAPEETEEEIEAADDTGAEDEELDLGTDDADEEPEAPAFDFKDVAKALKAYADEEPEAPAFDFKDVAKALKAYAVKNGGKKALALLATFKVKSAKDLKPAQFEAVIKATGKK
jgi:hypothetical protein